MGTVAVIGAGASGIIAALTASERHNVVLLDGNDKCGKKIEYLPTRQLRGDGFEFPFKNLADCKKLLPRKQKN